MGEANRRKDTSSDNTHDMAATRALDKSLKERIRDLTKVLVAPDHINRKLRRELARVAKEST